MCKKILKMNHRFILRTVDRTRTAVYRTVARNIYVQLRVE
jgi:hypothetical protein